MKNDLTACRGGMLREYYLSLFQSADRERALRLEAVRTRSDAEKYREEVREKLRKCFGPVPEVNLLSVQKKGAVKTPKLVVEKTVLETAPGRFMPVLFYAPAKTAGPLPGILLLCGHAGNGKAHRSYQEACQSMALRGFGVLCPEAFGQGERREFGGGPGHEHDLLGLRTALCGEFFGTWRLFDALSALEYLRSRQDIDAAKIGVTGCSGGGTLTSYVTAFSDIPCMAAPICSITRMTRNLANEIHTDCEQTPPDFKRLGLEETDLFLAHAPRPCYLGLQDNDFFDPRGTEEIAAELRKFYQLFDAADKIELGRGTGDHGFTAFHRNAIGKFFSGLVSSHAVGDDGDIAVFPEEELFCTPSGDVRNQPGSRTAGEMLQDLAERTLSSGNLQELKVFLDIRPPEIPDYRKGFQQYLEELQLHACRFLLNTEPGIEIELKKIGKTVQNKLDFPPEITLLVPEKNGLPEFPGQDDCWMLEVRGTGETLSCQPDADLMIVYPPLYNASGLMTGRTMFNGMIRDLLASLAFLKTHQVKKVRLKVKGSMIYPVLAAAVWSPLPLEIEGDVKPVTWRNFVRRTNQTLPSSCLPFGILRYTDLPQLEEAARQAGHTICYRS